MNPGYFTLAAIDLKPQQMPMFLHISARVWGHRWSPHIRTKGLHVKTIIIYQLKRLFVPDGAYTENMFINSIHVSLYDISLTQNILYQIKRDVAVWKNLYQLSFVYEWCKMITTFSLETGNVHLRHCQSNTYSSLPDSKYLRHGLWRARGANGSTANWKRWWLGFLHYRFDSVVIWS